MRETHATQFSVEISLARIERRHGLGDRRIFMRPIEPGAGQQTKDDRKLVLFELYLVSVTC